MSRVRFAPVSALLGWLCAFHLLSCSPGGVVPDSSLSAALLQFVVTLPDSLLPDSLCRRLYVHPVVGQEWLAFADHEGRAWRAGGRLPVGDGDTVRAGERVVLFAPFRIGGPSGSSCAAIAAHLKGGASSDQFQVYLEVFSGDGGRWNHQYEIGAAASKNVNSWEIRLTAIMW